jgi:pimeloyl-ACP methyl ester carboxylesterase
VLQSSSSKNSTNVRSRNSLRFAKAALQTAYLLSDNLGTGLAERLFTTPRRYPRPDRERGILASARTTTIEVTLRSPRWNGAKVVVPTWRWGHGPAVLLVHGWEGRGSQLGAFVRPLVAAGLSVVAFDAPGHGDAPEHRIYLTDVADAIADVAAAVGPLHGLVAHSFGAAGALLAHARNNVASPRNVMIAPNVIIEDSVRKFARLVGLDDADRTALELRLAAHTGLSIQRLRVDDLAGRRTDELLVVHDRDDREVGFEHGERLAQVWRGAELVATSGLGHRRILRDDDVIAAAVARLRDGIRAPVSDLVREIDRQLEMP